MNKTETMRQLEAMGTAQNRKVYARHFGEIDMFGVSYANLGKLRRTIKIDQELAEQLWATGNLDACILATMIADPERMTAAQLDAWARSSFNRGTASALSDLAAKTRTASKRVEKWIKSKNEWISATGWHTLASLARDDEEFAEDALADYLEKIEATIDSAKNYTRYAMNNAMISIGTRNARLRKLAVAAAKRIGEVEVDHGATSCTTPDAVTAIPKGDWLRQLRNVDLRGRI